MTWLGKSNYQPAIRDDVFKRRPPQRPVQRGNAVSGYHRLPDPNVRSTVTAEPSGAILVPSGKDAAKLAAAIVWREAPVLLTRDDVVAALGSAAFERHVKGGELAVAPMAGGRELYQRDEVRRLLMSGAI